MTTFQQLADRRPDEAFKEAQRLYSKRAKELAVKDEPWAAIRMLEQGLSAFPNNIHFINQLSSLYTRIQNRDKALFYMEESYRLDPRDTRTILHLAKAYRRERRYPLAETILKEGRSIYPADIQLINTLANLYTGQHRFSEAEGLLVLGHNIHSQNIVTTNMLAKIYMIQAKQEKAEDLLLRNLDIEPNNMYTITSLGYLYAREGNLQAAENVFLWGRSVHAGNCVNICGLGHIFLRAERYLEFNKLMRETVDFGKDDANYLCLFAKGSLHQYEIEAAQKAATAALNIKTDKFTAVAYIATADHGDPRLAELSRHFGESTYRYLAAIADQWAEPSVATAEFEIDGLDETVKAMSELSFMRPAQAPQRNNGAIAPAQG